MPKTLRNSVFIDLPLKTMADVAPITPKKGEYIGLSSAVAILNLCVLSEKMGRVKIERRGVVTCRRSCQKSPLDLSHKTRQQCGRGLLRARVATTKDRRLT